MLETLRYETDRRLRGTAVFVAIVAAYAAFAVALFPSFEDAAVDLEELIQSYPPAIREAFGVEALGTLEGFIATEFYNFAWVLILGVYFAYRAGGLVAADRERDRLDLLLSFPISRTRLLAEKYAALLVPIIALNVGVAVVVYAATLAIGESLTALDLLMVHLLSIPYLLACAGIGLVFSVLVDRADVAQRLALGVMFLLYLLESIAATVDTVSGLQYLSPTYYYAPTPTLVRGEYHLLEAGVLVLAVFALFGLSALIFTRRDI